MPVRPKVHQSFRITANHPSRAYAHLYTRRWRQASATFRAQHPLCQCEQCESKPVAERLPSTVVDHHVPHRGDWALFWDRTNWRALNKRCHDSKTVRADGGFGNPRVQG